MESKIPKRRRTIKVLAGGGVAASELMQPGTWTKPVLKSIALPAHATTSDVSADESLRIECTLTFVDPCTSQFMLVGSIVGPDVTGQSVSISFTGVFITFPGSSPVSTTETTMLSTTVGAGNQFSESFVVAPSDGSSIWQSGGVTATLNGESSTHTFGTPVTPGLVPLCIIDFGAGTFEDRQVAPGDVAGLLATGAVFGQCQAFLCGAT